ncbi:unnamed protein product [Arctia plantaginis]|uniref:TNFR-Cys domain-containing protein n=1 Tax=Arctia plantaginis TaxID=874455 RepID=A0A8S1BAJ5_ARCPL|nr:unnamed protein product [Arctia plantaginis]
MFREGAVLCLWALCLSVGHSQPVSCTDGDHCTRGYYCDTEAKKCRECLRCQDFKREPLEDNTCITSIDKCGLCFKGYVIDRLGDVNAPCVISGTAEPAYPPNYVWWLIGVSVFIFLSLMIGIIVYIYVNPGVFKFAGNCPSGTVSTNILTAPRPTAPEAPPPYQPPYNDVPYTSVRTTESPCPPTLGVEDIGDINEEYGSFIKPMSRMQQSGPRQSDANQTARVFNPETPIITEVNDNLPVHDEVTADSNWTPNGPSNADINANVSEATSEAASEAASGALSQQLAVARDTTLIEHAPKRKRLSAPSSNNGNRESSSGADYTQGHSSGTQTGAPYNFITQITNVVQINQTS